MPRPVLRNITRSFHLTLCPHSSASVTVRERLLRAVYDRWAVLRRLFAEEAPRDSGSPKRFSFKIEIRRKGEIPNDGKNGAEPSGPTPPPQPSWSWTNVILTALIYFGIQSLSDNGGVPAKQISWQEFERDILPTGEVEKLVFDKDANVVYVHLLDGAVINDEPVQKPGTRGALRQYRLSVGSLKTFERQLEEAQTSLGIDSRDFVPVSFIHHSHVLDIIAVALPLLIIGGTWLYFSRRSPSSSSSSSSGISGMPGFGFDSKASGLRTPGGMGSMKPTIILPSDPAIKKTSFVDVAGMTEAKTEVMEFVQFLKAPERITTLGGKLPKGALLVGPPGTGKTLLAKAIAGEAGVPFFAVSGSDFVEMFVGVGPSRVRDLFAQARSMVPCILYIDEIDAVGKARSTGAQRGGDSERENTLNQLLVEMDGFNTVSGLIMLASTNRADMLDKALLRPGRFDRQIMCDLPFKEEREQIFRVHMRGLKLINTLTTAETAAPTTTDDTTAATTLRTVNLHTADSTTSVHNTADTPIPQHTTTASTTVPDPTAATTNADDSQRVVHAPTRPNGHIDDALVSRLASLTPGLSGAQIASICNEAALYAARHKHGVVDAHDFEYAVDRVVGGLERPRVISPEEKRKIAFHEAGHVLVGWFLEHIDPILKVNIIPRGNNMGFSQYLPADLKLYTSEQLDDKMCALLGGRAAEALALRSISTGAKDDLQKVTRIAYQMVASFGMSTKVGPINLTIPNPEEGRRAFSNNLSEMVDKEVHALVAAATVRAEHLVVKHMDKLELLAQRLLEKETITHDDILAVLGPRPGNHSPVRLL